MTDPTSPEPRTRRRVWVLTGYDPATGCATRPVAVAGTIGGAHKPDGEGGEEGGGQGIVSWIPLEHIAAERWQTILATATVPLALLLEHWAAEADGITIDVAELAELPAGSDLRGTVEVVVDEILTGSPPLPFGTI
jgi:hypothetical protein